MDAARISAVVLVGAMCVVSIYGAARIPADARWPIRFGGFGFESRLGRNTGLVLWPLLGAAVASVAWMDDGSFAGLVVIGLVLMLWAQLVGVARLTRS
jgi:hypothetical protein